MLSQKTIDLIKSTAPLLEGQGPSITQTFYAHMFKHNPELLNIFNHANQRQGTLAQALFAVIVNYAKNIDNISVLTNVIARITHKHTSVAVKPEQYAIIGAHLLSTIQSTFKLSEDHEILTAWSEAYQGLADIFIDTEEKIYATNASYPGGWRDFKTFVITRIKIESTHVKSFYLNPVDGSDVVPFKAGQYLSIKVKPSNSKYTAIRQYSLSQFDYNNGYRISTKREDQGTVTQFMHNLKENDQIEVQAPAGVFVITDRGLENNQQVVFISGGIGITPLLTMAQETRALNPNASITFIQCVKDKRSELFAEEIKAIKDVDYKLCLSTGSEGDHEGLIDSKQLAVWANQPNANFYTCGPLAFMKAVYRGLKANNIPLTQIYYEVFGPDESLETQI